MRYKTLFLSLVIFSMVLIGCSAGPSSNAKLAEQQEQLDWFGNWILNYADTLRKLPQELRDIEKMEQTFETTDVWGNELHYQLDPNDSFTLGLNEFKNGFTIISSGPDGQKGTADDMVMTCEQAINKLNRETRR